MSKLAKKLRKLNDQSDRVLALVPNYLGDQKRWDIINILVHGCILDPFCSAHTAIEAVEEALAKVKRENL